MSVHRVTDLLWEEICERVRKSLVFVDDQIAECLHWHGGLLRLLNAGAVNVKEFSSFEKGGEGDEKAVMIVSGSLMRDDVRDVCRDIIHSSNFRYVIVITAHPLNEQTQVFTQTEEDIAYWMGNLNYTSEVFYYPLFTASITRDIFITPNYSNLFPVLPTYLDSLRKRSDKSDLSSLSELTISHLPPSLQSDVRSFTNNLNSLLHRMKIREECFCLGDLSRIVASQLANLPEARQRKKMPASTPISLLLVDRTLDLSTVTSHSLDSLLDKIIHALPHLPSHTTDCGVDMSSLSHTSTSHDLMVPGCLAHPSDSIASALLHKLITSKEKESLIELNRQLVDAGSRERISIRSKVGRVTAEFLKSNITCFKSCWPAIRRYSPLLQMCLASVECVESYAYKRWSKLCSVEQGLLQGVEGVGPSALAQLVELVGESNLSVEEFLTLLVFIYSINGEECAESVQEEKDVENLLVELILRECNPEPLNPLVKCFVGEHADEDVNDSAIIKHVSSFFDKLHSLSEVRRDMKTYRNLSSRPGESEPVYLTPLLGQLSGSLTNNNQDVQYIPGGLTGKIKSGISYFMSVGQPKVGDSPTILIYVLGGVTAHECKLLLETSPTHKIIIGSNRLLRTTDVLQQLLQAI